MVVNLATNIIEIYLDKCQILKKRKKKTNLMGRNDNYI